MVSLRRNFNTTSGGATFFSESGVMEDREQLQPQFGAYGVFKPLNTIPTVSFHLLTTLSLEITAIVLAALHPKVEDKCRSYFIVLYIHVALWFITLFLDFILKSQHHELRMNGYLEFYKNTSVHQRLPFYIVSLWNCVILLLQTIFQHYYPNDFVVQCLRDDHLTPLNYLCAVITLEVCVLFGINTSYIVKVRKFNKLKLLPDVLNKDWAACSTEDAFREGEVGYRPNGDQMNDFIEKQADLIKYLKEHNNRLSSEVSTLKAHNETLMNR